MSDIEVAGWRAWYDDGRVYSSVTDQWAALPDAFVKRTSALESVP